MIDLVLIALLQAAVGEPAPAAEAPAQAAEQQAEQVEAENEASQAERRRCRREVIVGTRLTRRVCTTASEDRQIENDAREFTSRTQSQMPLQGN
jgi:hypothetical protein